MTFDISTGEVSANFVGHCANGCLFELNSDPLESNDLAAAKPAKLQELQLTGYKLQATRDKLHATSCTLEATSPPSTSQITNSHTQMRTDPQELHAKLEKYETTAFNPNRGAYNGAACHHALHEYGGFWGPFLP